MSRLLVNTIRSYSGSTITIPSTTRLSLGGAEITENSVLPSASGQNNEAIGSDGTSVIYDTYGATNIQVFQSSGTYTKAAGVNTVMVRLVAAGGGGSGHCEAGGAGGFSEGIFNVNGITSVSVVVGVVVAVHTILVTTQGGSVLGPSVLLLVVMALTKHSNMLAVWVD